MVSQTSQLMHSDNYDLQHETHSIKLCITSHSIPWKWWKISGLINLYLSKVYCAVLIIYYLVFVLFVSFCSCAAFWSRYLLSLFASYKVQWPRHASLSSITTKFTDNYKTQTCSMQCYVKISCSGRVTISYYTFSSMLHIHAWWHQFTVRCIHFWEGCQVLLIYGINEALDKSINFSSQI